MLVFVGGPVGLNQVADRLKGVKQALRGSGAKLTVIETEAPNVAGGREAGEQIAGLAKTSTSPPPRCR
ncbi:hypothetical protein [Jatrophihabitans lederbergiae]|uniref:Uncharacterized protein n=1 Tax=Jatrophihabitans lederbergiae TaxID=3075547 RepID=A0ABU2JEY2_9ACTN|nr:hypothetical protein [Jatrophihabitans sp. DSM 44399]MDT0263531.1 hypothetical protein [Jatrophihabitans sp. DSM 44399]